MLCKTGSWGMPGGRQAVTSVTQDAVCVYFPLERASVGPRGLMRCGKLEKKPLSWLNPMEMHAHHVVSDGVYHFTPGQSASGGSLSFGRMLSRRSWLVV